MKVDPMSVTFFVFFMKEVHVYMSDGPLFWRLRKCCHISPILYWGKVQTRTGDYTPPKFGDEKGLFKGLVVVITKGPSTPVFSRGCQNTSRLTVYPFPRLFVRMDGNGTPRLKESPNTDGLRTTKGKGRHPWGRLGLTEESQEVNLVQVRSHWK